MSEAESAEKQKSSERAFMLDCIRVYRALPSLWKVKSSDYNNRDKKKKDYEFLLKKYREKFPTAKMDDLKKKFNALRTNFRKELKKVDISKKSGAGTEEIYEPTLWYFDEMRFLIDQETPAESLNTMDSDDDCFEAEEIENVSSNFIYIYL